MRYIDIQEKTSDNLYNLTHVREKRDFRLVAYILGFISVITIVGIIFLFQGKTTEGVGIISGGLGTVLGFLGGYGVSRKLAGQ